MPKSRGVRLRTCCARSRAAPGRATCASCATKSCGSTLAVGDEVTAADLQLVGGAAGAAAGRGVSLTTLDLAELERIAIAQALDAAGGTKTEAARLLGISRRALYNKLERGGEAGG